MSLISAYFTRLVNGADKWAVLARNLLDQTSLRTLASVAGIISWTTAPLPSTNPTSCPGYVLKNVTLSTASLTATLQLASEPCNLYGPDIEDLGLLVEYQAGK